MKMLHNTAKRLVSRTPDGRVSAIYSATKGGKETVFYQWTRSLNSRPEVYPLLGCLGLGAAMIGWIAYRKLVLDPEVRTTQQRRRTIMTDTSGKIYFYEDNKPTGTKIEH